MKEIDEYLEKRGAKYFVTLTVFCYVIGTVIFNIYLNSISITEFNLLKLRYMFVGLMFLLITLVLPFLYFLGKKFLRKDTSEDFLPEIKPKKKTWIEILVVVIFIPWTAVYSTYIFPKIPAAFGGAKPETVRLIGDPETIQELNELIAFETGVEVEKLPFQYATEKSNLAIGANVKILDRNSDRYVLLLTKDLYLSSTSNIAKELLESGEVDSFESSDDFFRAKPIYFSSENIRGTTTTLFEPSKMTTSDDLRIAARVVAKNPEKAKAVENVIAKDLPGSANKIIEAVQNLENSGEGDNSNENDIQTILDEAVDAKFLKFRSTVFDLAGKLSDQERSGSKSINGRKNLVETITNTFRELFPAQWDLFSGDGNYLIVGQDEKDFPRVLQGGFRGADSAKVVIERLNALEVKEDDFIPVISEAKLLFESSSQENNEYNRKFMSEVLVRHFNQKARKHTAFWSEPKYLYSGVHDENYFENLRNFFEKSTSWEVVKELLDSYQASIGGTVSEEVPEDVSDPESEPPADSSEEETPTESEEPSTEEIPAEDPPAEEEEVPNP